jgi:UDPglucose 6-dehydrogenase
MKITIIGPGFVGLTSGAVYASFGHKVIGLDIDQKKIDDLNKGVVSFYEPKLTELVRAGIEAGNLSFTTSYEEAISKAELIIISVPTPNAADGSVDLFFFYKTFVSLAPFIKEDVIFAIKSTVPPATLERVQQILAEQKVTKKFYLASLPEFLKEGTAVDDTLAPDRVLIGVTDDYAYNVLADLHAPLKAPLIRLKPNSAQLAKYTANNYLALRIAFINEIANICTEVGADIEEVIRAIGDEKRIGAHYWYPGLGYGGSCFPKDVKGLAHIAADNGFGDNLFAKVDQLNSERPAFVLNGFKEQIEGGWQGKKVAVLGLSFKPQTDDQRVAPALAVIPYLLNQGAEVVAYDPMVKKIASRDIAEQQNYKQAATIEEAISAADAIIALIEWPQIVGFDFPAVNKEVVFIDARNQFCAATIRAQGYKYLGIGK